MIKHRIEILKQAAVINEDVAEYVNRVIDLLGDEYEIAKMEMFTTHLAMATQRIANNNPVGNLDEVIWKEVIESKHYVRATEIYDSFIYLSPIVVPEEEKKFLIMHICNLLQD